MRRDRILTITLLTLVLFSIAAMVPAFADGTPTGSLLNSAIFGGTGNEQLEQNVAIGSDGSIYVAGTTDSVDLPVTAGAFRTTAGGLGDIYIAKYSSDMSTLLACTYFGGSGSDVAYDVTIGSDGNVYLTGNTYSDGIATMGVYRTTRGNCDAFVAKFDPSLGTLLACTYFGGTNEEIGRTLIIGSDGNIYFAGTTKSSGLATTGAYDTTKSGSPDVFVAKFDSSFSTLLACTYLGGSSSNNVYEMAIGTDGSLYLAGSTNSAGLATAGSYQSTRGSGYDAYIAQFDPSLSTLLACTYLGANGGDYGYGIAIGSDNSVCLTGKTASTELATAGAYSTTMGGTQDAFAARFDPSLSTLLACTYLGGSGEEIGYSIAIDDDRIYVTGQTGSTDLPTTPGAYSIAKTGQADAFIICIDQAMSSLIYGTYYGVTTLVNYGYSLGVQDDGNLIVAGATNSNSISPAWDAFVTKWHFGGSAAIAPVADFSADVTSGLAPLAVQFSDLSTVASSWSWDFNGDSVEDSAVQNPSYTYQTPGVYTVSLTATNSAGSDTEVKTGYVTVYATPVISASPATLSVSSGGYRTYQIIADVLPYGLSGYALNISIDNPTIGEITDVSYPAWASLNTTPGMPGDSVKISALDLDRMVEAGATNVVLVTITVRGDLPGTASLVLSNVDMDYDGGVPVTPGVNNGQLNVYVGLTAEFSATPVEGLNPLAVQFNDMTTGISGAASWSWDFGDGSASTLQDPLHEYVLPGAYTVTLTVTNEYGTSTTTKTGLIVVKPRVEAFPGKSTPPADLDGDGLYEDINGNGRLDFDDIVTLYQNIEWAKDNTNVGPTPYDYNGNGRIDFDDIVVLYQEKLG